MFVNLKVWKPEIIAILGQYTGKDATIDGNINFSLYPYPQIVIEDVSIYDDFEDKDILPR